MRRLFNALASLILAILLGGCQELAVAPVPTDPKPSPTTATDPVIGATTAPLSYADSVVILSATSVNVHSTVGVTMAVYDVNDNPLNDPGLSVNFALAGGTSLGVFSSVTDQGNGTYTATLTGVSIGTATGVIATIGGTVLVSTPPSITVTADVATKISIETRDDGTGVAVSGTLNNATPVTMYAVGRDPTDHFIQLESVTWSESAGLGSFSTTSGTSAIYTPTQGAGTTVISATSGGGLTTGTANLTVTWTPTGITGLVSWLKADSLGLTDGAGVSSWTDVSGTGNPAVQAISSSQPTFTTSALNGLPALAFNGTSDYMSLNNNAGLQTGNVSVFVVAKTDVERIGTTFLSKSSATPATDGWGITDLLSDGSTIGLFVNNPGADRSGGSFPIGSYTYFSGIYDGSTVKFYINGTAYYQVSYSTPISNPAVNLLVGATAGHTDCSLGCLQGAIAEIILYGVGVTDTSRQNIESYLSAKYGF